MKTPDFNDVLDMEYVLSAAERPATLYGHPAIQQLLYFTDHAISASEEGVPYAIPRVWLDVMTAMGLMEKVGRGRWAVTDSAQSLLDVAASDQRATQP